MEYKIETLTMDHGLFLKFGLSFEVLVKYDFNMHFYGCYQFSNL